MINSMMILDFWFKECTPKMWFKKDKEFDALIKNRFQKILEFCLEKKINNDHFTKEDYLSWIIETLFIQLDLCFLLKRITLFYLRLKSF